MNKTIILAITIPFLYFSIVWTVPWDDLTPSSWSVSTNYIFDLIFSVSVLFYFRVKNWVGKIALVGLLLRLATIIVLGVTCNSIIDNTPSLVSPFGYIQNITVQLLILAPILEELVFRGAFFEALAKTTLKPWIKTAINATLFSLSHAFALTLLPEQFHSFVYFQLIYTLFLGWFCTKSRERSGGIVEPVILHFCFNFIFYMWVS